MTDAIKHPIRWKLPPMKSLCAFKMAGRSFFFFVADVLLERLLELMSNATRRYS